MSVLFLSDYLSDGPQSTDVVAARVSLVIGFKGSVHPNDRKHTPLIELSFICPV